jgi:DNA-binding transcriptional LysR family regulator
VLSYEPANQGLASSVIYADALTFVVSPRHRFAGRKTISIKDLGLETFIAHNVTSPYRAVVLAEFQRYKVPLNIDVEMPTIDAIRRFVQSDQGVAFLPRMCVERELAQRTLREVRVRELKVERNIRLVYPRRRTLSHAARAFLAVVES